MSSIIETAPVATWRKSSYSGDDTNPAQCVELADLVGTVGVRDSKQDNGPVLEFGRPELAALVGAVKTGRYDR
jgi:hypothetical protein